MTDLVVWTGPVARFQVPGATIPGAKELFLQCCGDLTPPCQPPTCPTIGGAVMGSPEALLARAGMSRDELGDLFFGAFSAGGSIVKRVLSNPEYRAITTAVHLADATYTSVWENKGQRIPPAIEGYVRFGVDVAQGAGDQLFIATASPVPNKSWASGVENLGSIRREIEKRTGQQFVLRSDFFGIDPAPEHLYQLGNVLFAEYPMTPLGHGHTTIARQVWENIIQPWVANGKGPIDQLGPVPPGPNGPPPVPLPTSPAPDPLASVLALAIGATVGYVGVTRLLARRRT